MASRKQFTLEFLLGARRASSFNSNIAGAKNTLNGISSTGRKVAAGLTAAFAAVNIKGAISDAVDIFSEFDQSLATSAATFNATTSEYEALRVAARDAGKSTSKTASESADALGYMALAGWDVSESTQSLMPVLKTSVAANLDLAETSDLVTDSMSALKLEVSNLPEYLNTVIKGNDTANMTSQQMMQSMILAGGAANTLKIGYQDLGTAVGILANNGTKGAKSGTALNSMLTRMASNDNAIGQMKRLKISIFDANGEFVGLENALMAINKGLAGLNTEKKARALKQIAGTQYYSKMVYLLDSVKEGANGADSAWDELNDNLNNADGALDTKYAKMTDTVSGHTDTMKSAFEDMQISFVDAFSGEYMDILDDLAGAFNTASDFITDFAQENEIQIHNFFEGIRENVGDFVEFSGNTVEFVVDNSDKIEAVLEGVAIAATGFKAAKGITSITKALMGMTNPIALMVAGVGAAVASVVAVRAAIRNAEQEAAQNNLESHFGNIALSLDDIDEVAQNIVGKKKLTQISTMLEAIGDTSDAIDDLDDDLKNISRIEWKMDAGFKISADDKEAYVSNVNQYMEDAQGVLDKQGYSVSVATDVLLGKGSSMGAENDAFYAGLDEKMGKLSGRLKKKINKAVKNGIDIDTDESVREILDQMDEITDAITGAENEAALQSIEMKYSGKDLDADTTKALIGDIAKYEKEVTKGADEAFKTSMTNLNARLNLGDITQEEYDVRKNQVQEGYFNTRAEAYKNGLTFVENTVNDAYPGLKKSIDKIQSKIDAELKKAMDEGISGEQLNDKLKGIAKDATEGLKLSDAEKGAVKMLIESGYNDIFTQAEDLETQMHGNGMKTPKGLKDRMNNSDAIMAMTGDVEDMYYMLGDKIGNSPEYTAVVNTAKEAGGNLPIGIAEGIERNSGEVTSAVQKMLSDAQSASGGTIYTGTVKISTSTAKKALDEQPKKVSGIQNTVGPVKKNALGGIYNKEIITRVAEGSYSEAIIPLDGSSNGMSILKRAASAFGVTINDGRGATGSAGGSANLYSSKQSAGSAPNISYSPQIIIQGNADKKEIMEALDTSQEKFAALMNQWFASKERTNFGGGVSWQS